MCAPAAVSVAAADRVRSSTSGSTAADPRTALARRTPDAARRTDHPTERTARRPRAPTTAPAPHRRRRARRGSTPPPARSAPRSPRRAPTRSPPAASACACTASASSSTQGRSAASEPAQGAADDRPRAVRTGQHREPPLDRRDDRGAAAAPRAGPGPGTTNSGDPCSPCPRSRSSRSPRTVGSDAGGTRLSTIAIDAPRSTAPCSTRHGSASPYRAAVVTKSHRSAASSSRCADSRFDSSTESRSGASSSAIPRGTCSSATTVTDSRTGWCESSSSSSGWCTSTGRRVVGRSTPAVLTSEPDQRVHQRRLARTGRPRDHHDRRRRELGQARDEVLTELVDEPGPRRPRRRDPLDLQREPGALHVPVQVPDRVEQRRRRQRAREDVAGVGRGMAGVCGRWLRGRHRLHWRGAGLCAHATIVAVRSDLAKRATRCSRVRFVPSRGSVASPLRLWAHVQPP